jgi:hypothetical protein
LHGRAIDCVDGVAELRRHRPLYRRCCASDELDTLTEFDLVSIRVRHFCADLSRNFCVVLTVELLTVFFF